MTITWRNVNAPQASVAADLIRSGGQGITGGLSSLAGLAGRLGKEQEAEREQGFKDVLAGLQSQALVEDDPTKVMDLMRSAEAQGLDPTRQLNLAKALTGRVEDIETEERSDLAFEQAQDRLARQKLLEGREDLTYGEQREDIRQQRLGETEVTNLYSLLNRTQEENRAKEDTLANMLQKDNLTIDASGKVSSKFGRPDPNAFSDKQSADAAITHYDTFMAQKQAEVDALNLKDVPNESQLRSALRNSLTKSGLSPSEIDTHMVSLGNVIKEKGALPPEAMAQAQSQISNTYNQIDLQMQFKKEELDNLKDLSPRSMSPQERNEATSEVMRTARELSPDSSWLGGEGGEELRNRLAKEVVSIPGATPDMIKLALLSYAQTDEEAWGNPTADIDKIKELVTDLASGSMNARNLLHTAKSDYQKSLLEVGNLKKKISSDITRKFKKDLGIEPVSRKDIYRRLSAAQ